MNITFVKSSQIVAVGRGEIGEVGDNPDTNTPVHDLCIYFGQDGHVQSVYSYPDAPVSLVERWLEAPSIGAEFHRAVKNVLKDYMRLEGDELAAALADLEAARPKPEDA